MKAPASIIFLTLMTGCSFGLITTATAQENNQNLDFSKAWFKPSLIENKDSVCASLLTQTQQDFFSHSATQRPLGEAPKGPVKDDQHWTWIETTPFEGLALYQGTAYTRGYLGHGCGGACESEYFVVSKSPLNSGSYGDTLSLAENQITDEVPAYAGNSGLYKHQNGSYYVITKGEVFSAYKPMPNAIWNKVCEIQIAPNETTYKKIPDIYNSINKLNTAVAAIVGSEGSYCGSMHTLSRWKQYIHETLEQALYQPWMLHESTNNDSTYAIDIANLESWSLKDISQKLAFEAYKKQLAITTKDLSLFYQKNYQWQADTSDNLASNALKTAISSGIRFYMYDQVNPAQKKLINAIVEKQPISAIKSLADMPNALTNLNLSLAINYPQALELLLTKISNPNQQNEFKKSLLMYAAQYNQLESAKILLNKGANPNLFTIIPEDTCNFTLSKSNMTALHYAVRYASADLIKLLLKSGANPYASTSEENEGRPIDWLHKYATQNASEINTNLIKDNIPELEKLLTLPTKEEREKRVLTYNLAAEQAFQKENLDDAYDNSALALGLDEKNERTLSNMSLILLKQKRPYEALETSNKLISKGTDKSQIANAWFNYGLICERESYAYYIDYNGNKYCRYGILYPFIESFKNKQTTPRAEKIVKLINESQKDTCKFYNENNNLITVIRRCSDRYEYFCVLHTKDISITPETFSLLKEEHSNPNDLSTTSKLIISKPIRIEESIPLGQYQLTKLYTRGYQDIQFGDRICNSSSEVQAAPKHP